MTAPPPPLSPLWKAAELAPAEGNGWKTPWHLEPKQGACSLVTMESRSSEMPRRDLILGMT